MQSAPRVSRFREIGEDRLPEFLAKGYKQRHLFPHRLYYLPKCGPDAFQIASARWSDSDPEQMWELVLYADRSVTKHFPNELFFDDDVIWHRQHFGKVGQVASANLIVREGILYTTVHISDLVQRISRRRDLKTRVENTFKGWNHMLLNGILNFAQENQLSQVFTPTAKFALQHTDPARHPSAELFERIYDRNVVELFDAVRDGDWWQIDLAKNINRIIIPERRSEPLPKEKIICIAHDIERGLGHEDSDLALAFNANQSSDQFLDQMLSIEAKCAAKATYNVVGAILAEVEERIAAGGHCLGFHSYDHRIASGVEMEAATAAVHAKMLRAFGMRDPSQDQASELTQLEQCRRIDYRIKGYQPPQSKITAELTSKRLLVHNFEWFASSAGSIGLREAAVVDRLVQIPIHFDDYDLYLKRIGYSEWEEQAISTINSADFVVFLLHDCYGQFWLPQYERLLQQVRNLGNLKTLDEVAAIEAFATAL